MLVIARRYRALVATLFGAALTGAAVTGARAQQAALPQQGEAFGIHGSNTIGSRLMPALVEAYAGSRDMIATTKVGIVPEEVELELTTKAGESVAAISIHSHGSGTGVPGLISGMAQIGMLSRPVDEKEAKALSAAGLGLSERVREHVLALDGLAVLVGPDNPINQLTIEQIGDIFSGAIKDWSELGGPRLPIHIYARDDKSGTYDTFNSIVLKPRKLKLAESATRFESSEELSDSVARDPRGIGFVGLAYLRNAKDVLVVNDCGNPISARAFNVKTEEYPLSRRLYLYTAGLRPGSVAEGVLQYALSPASANAIRAAGFVDFEVERLDVKGQVTRLAHSLRALEPDTNVMLLKEMTTTLEATQRLSVTVRFRRASIELDSRAQDDIKRVATFMKALLSREPQRRLIIAGFSDTVGPFDVNAQLSLARAEVVRTALLREGGTEIPADRLVTKGYGELLPATCRRDPIGIERSRRVELWLW